MAKFKVVVTAVIPHYTTSPLIEVEADNHVDAMLKIHDLYEADLIGFSQPEANYDDAEIHNIRFVDEKEVPDS